MEMKGLSLRDVSERSGVDYSSCSRLLNGWLNHPAYFEKIKQAIEAAPEPEASKQ